MEEKYPLLKVIETEKKEFPSVIAYMKFVKQTEKKFKEMDKKITNLDKKINDLNNKLDNFFKDIIKIKHAIDTDYINSQTKEINNKLFKSIKFKIGSFCITKLNKKLELIDNEKSS